MNLYIGNKNYSSWSMRPWVLLRQADIPFKEVKILFDSFLPGSIFKQTILKINPRGQVPILVDGDLVVTDTLAIVEYLAESFPNKNLWPIDKVARAKARMACAEMHAGFAGLRAALPMNLEANLPQIGQLAMRDNPAVIKDVARVDSLWRGLLAEYAGTHRQGMLFGAFSIADAYFAPVVMRLKTYAISMTPEVSAYMDRLCAMPSVAAWVGDALLENEFCAFEEPYRLTH